MRPSSRWPKRPFSQAFYFAVASVLALMGFCFSAMADVSNVIRYAPNPPYDSIPITPKTWEEVDLIYYSTISGHRYTNAIQLLRPIAWLHKRHMDIIGSKVTLSMPEFGIVNVMATVKAIKPTQIDTRGIDWSKQNSAPVIGKFMRYVTDVRTYTFRDSLGHISHINATPNHPFYVKNKHGFVSIGNVSDDDTLVGGIGSGENHIDSAVHLVCAKGKHSHCGVAYGGFGLPTSVYNLEVYRRHVYRVGDSKLLVHNLCNWRAVFNVASLDELPNSVVASLTNDYAQSRIKYSATRMSYIGETNMIQFGPLVKTIQENRKALGDTTSKALRDYTASINKYGDCDDYCFVGMQFLRENGYKKRISMIEADAIKMNHFFLLIDDDYVIDSWSSSYYKKAYLDRFLIITPYAKMNGINPKMISYRVAIPFYDVARTWPINSHGSYVT